MAEWEATFKAHRLDVLTRLLNEGYTLPLSVAYIGHNGAISGGRYDEIDAIGLDFTLLTFHLEGDGPTLPIHMLVVDQRGEAVRVVFAPETAPRIIS
jgi:hypothetical protein